MPQGIIISGSKMDKKTKKMIRELEEQLEALVIAVPKEEAAHDFYLKLANSTKHEGTRKMFLQLAEQEEGHKRSLEQVVDQIQGEIAKLRAQAK